MPELRPVYQQLIDDEGLYDDGPPVRPYGFFDRSARFVQQLAAQNFGDPALEDMLRRLAAMLEEMASDYDDSYLPDLMGAGFVEAMNPDAPGFGYLVGFMGPASRAQVVATFGSDSV